MLHQSFTRRLERLSVLAALIVSSISSLPLSAQTTGSVTGNVADTSGAAVAGASLVLMNPAAGLNLTATSDSSGVYQFLQIPPGTYVLEATSAGFRTYRRQGIVVEGDRSQSVPVELALGQVTETLEVEAGAVLLEANTSAIGTVMDTQKIQDLPLNGRNPMALANLVPTVRGLLLFGGPVTKTFRASLVSIGGGPVSSNGFLLDGVPNDKTVDAPGAQTFLAADATQEFKVLTNAFSAEYGRSGGGIVSVISKSGTNEYHGVLSNYLRNTIFKANDFFGNLSGAPRPVLKINQWTGVLGGPIKKDKLFFFFNHEGYAERRAFNRVVTVPTALQRQGNFSDTRAANGTLITIYDPLTTAPNPNQAGAYIRTAFPGNVIPLSRQNKIAQSTFGLMQLPNVTTNSVTNINNLAQTASQPTDRYVFGLKVDYNISQNRRLAVRYTKDTVEWTYPRYWGGPSAPSPASAILDIEGRHNRIPRDSASLGYTETITPTLLLDFKAGYNRDREVGVSPFDEEPGQTIDPVAFGYPASFYATQHKDRLSPRGKFGAFTITDIGNLMWNNSNYRAGAALAGNASITKLWGSHTLKSGYQLVHYTNNTGGGGFARTHFQFDRGFTQGPNPNTPSGTAGFGTASFLLGTTSATNSSVSPFQAEQAMAQNFHSVFVQDDYRITRKLTLNLGLRWEYEAPMVDRFNQFTNFDPTITSPLQVPGLNLRGGAVFPPATGGSRYFHDPAWNHWGPRFGYAYQATAKLVLRGGYGISWIPTKGTPIYQFAGFRVANPMISSVDGGLTPYNTMADPYPGGVAGPTGARLGAATEIGSDFFGLLRSIRPGYAQQWNFTVQYQPWTNWLVEGAYLANRGLGLLTMQSINYNQLDPQYLSLGNALNQPVANPFFGIIKTGPLSTATVARQQLLRPFPQYNNVYGNYDFLGNSIYHAFTLKVEKRFSRDFSILATYVNSKLIDAAVRNAGVVNWYNLRAERSRSTEDVSQRMVITGLWELPFARTAKGWRRSVAGGWHINTIATLQSGLPISVSAAGGTGGGNRPNVVAGQNPEIENPTLARWFNTAAYSVPAAFTYGNSSRTIPNVSGPGIRTVDGSVFKDFLFRERFKVQFRAEVFNVTNTPNFGQPGGQVGSQAFGVINSIGSVPSREFQFSLRMTF